MAEPLHSWHTLASPKEGGGRGRGHFGTGNGRGGGEEGGGGVANQSVYLHLHTYIPRLFGHRHSRLGGGGGQHLEGLYSEIERCSRQRAYVASDLPRYRGQKTARN